MAGGPEPAASRHRRRNGLRRSCRLGQPERLQPRDAYRFVADFSVYVERAHRGRGVGRELVLSAFPFNTGGMSLYDKMGFRTVGIYKEQGQLDGRWVDTIVMEKIL